MFNNIENQPQTRPKNENRNVCPRNNGGPHEFEQISGTTPDLTKGLHPIDDRDGLRKGNHLLGNLVCKHCEETFNMPF